MIVKLILISIVLVAIAIALIAVKMFIVKGSIFTKTCSSGVITDDGKKMDCMCEKDPDYSCENYELHHGKLKDISQA
jgi:hypothetical protein